MASYFWGNTAVTSVQQVQFSPAFRTATGTLGVASPFTNEYYPSMTFNYLTNFHSEVNTQPTIQFSDTRFNTDIGGVITSIFPTNMCPRVFTFGTAGSGTLSVGGANGLYLLLKGGGGGGGAGGSGGPSIPNGGGGGGGGGGGSGAVLGRYIPVVPGTNFTYTSGAGGNAGGGLSGGPGGASTINYNSITYSAGGGLGGTIGVVGTSPGFPSPGAGGPGGTGGNASAISNPLFEVTLSGPSGNSGTTGPGATGGTAGNGGIGLNFPFAVNNPTSYNAGVLSSFGNGGPGGKGGARNPFVPAAGPGIRGNTGAIQVFFYF